MTVEELIHELSRFPNDAEVRFTQQTHNYWDEVLAQTIDLVDYAIVGGDNLIYDDPEAALDNAGYYSDQVVVIE